MPTANMATTPSQPSRLHIKPDSEPMTLGRALAQVAAGEVEQLVRLGRHRQRQPQRVDGVGAGRIDVGEGCAEAYDAGVKAYDKLGSVEKEISNLDPEDPKYRQKLMQLQQKMQGLQEMIAMIQKMMDARHQMAMQTIQSISR